MQLQPAQTERILHILNELPPGKVSEVIDFAEYLKSRQKKYNRRSHVESTVKLPVFSLGAMQDNACDRDALYGEYLATKPA